MRWLDLCGDRFYLELQRTGRRRGACTGGCVALAARAACRWSRPTMCASCSARGFRGARGAGVHPRRRAARRPRPPRRYSEEQYLRIARGNGALFADCPRRSPTRSRSRSAAAEITLGRRCCRTIRCRPAARPSRFLREEAARACSPRGSARWRIAGAAGADRAYRAAPGSSSASSADGLRRLLPDRGRFHPLGARATACRWARAAARAPARWWPTRCASPTRSDAHDLLFERFLNPERVSMPDFDVDFCMEGRDRVIDYVAQEVRPRPRLADHHLRHHGGQGGGARCRPRARPQLRLSSTGSPS
jgi:DNA polymerase III subunit alpha